MSIRRPSIALMLLALVAAILPVAPALKATPAGATPSANGGCPDGSYPAVVTTDVGFFTLATISYLGLDTASTGFGPKGVDVKGNRYAYVANSGSANVSVIDLWAPDGGSTVALIAVGNGPSGVAVSPTADRAYVSNYDDGTVSVIDTAGNTVVTSISGFSQPYDIAVSPDGSTVWVAEHGTDTVARIQTSDNTVQAHVSVGSDPAGPVVSPNGAKVYVANFVDGTISVVTTADNSVSTLISLTAGVNQIAITSDGATLFVSNTLDATVVKVSVAGPSVVGTIPSTEFDQPYGLDLTPDDSMLFVADEAGFVQAFDADTLSPYGPPVSTMASYLYLRVVCLPIPTVPAPTDVTAALVTPSGNALSVDATPPASGDDPTGYQVRCMPVSYPWHSGDGGPVVYKGTETLPVTVGGLTRGLDYKCFVRARYGSELFSWLGDDNEGPLSASSNVVRVPAVAPPVPTGVVASVPSAPDPRATAVSFSLPANPSGAPVTANTARCTSSTGGATRTATGSATGPVTVTGLTAGARYTCAVASTNSAGTSSFSTASAAIDVPAAPVTGVVASVANSKTRTISVRFTPPVGATLAPVRYEARCATVQGAPLTVTGTAGSSPVSVFGATGGRFYRCAVRAVYAAGNSGGDSAWSNTVKVG